jgi:hypothetical protein
VRLCPSQFPGFTALHHAAAAGHAALVELLLAFGADAQAPTARGQRPLELARDSRTRAALQPARVARARRRAAPCPPAARCGARVVPREASPRALAARCSKSYIPFRVVCD